MNIHVVSGITQKEYRLLKQRPSFDWKCSDCKVEDISYPLPQFDNSHLSLEHLDQDLSQVGLPLASFNATHPQATETSSVASNSHIHNQHTVYVEPQIHHESQLVESVMDTDDVSTEEITWELVTGSTERNGTHLVNSIGYTYVLHKLGKSEGIAHWRCAQRNSAKCKARVNQKSDDFSIGIVKHLCTPKP